MLGAPDLLADFLLQLAAYEPAAAEELELVINGDFIDFLAEVPGASWTVEENTALAKLEMVFRRLPGLFDALAKCVSAMSRFTLLLGNHDIELAYPRVRDALLRRLGTEQHRCLFIQSNEGYRIGDLLIEHGNRYDPWNTIDYDGLRKIVSSASRGEKAESEIVVCPGSKFVHEVMNPLKERYRFVDLLKPETKLIVLLLSAFEPQLKRDLAAIFRSASAYAEQFYRRALWTAAGPRQAPGQRRFVARSAADDLPRAVLRAFDGELKEAMSRQPVAAGEKLRRLFLRDTTQSLKTKLENGESIEPERLEKLRSALHAKLVGDTTFDESDGTDDCAEAARTMLEAGVAKVVVFGHTHLRRNVEFGGGRYVNTGTWADLIRVDEAVLADDDDGRALLVAWLRKLVTNDLDELRVREPSYADIRVDADGHVVVHAKPMLSRHVRGERFA